MTRRLCGLHRGFAFRVMRGVALIAGASMVAWGVLGLPQHVVTAEEPKGRDLIAIEQVTLDLADTIVRDQAKKPPFPHMLSTTGIESLLASVELSAEQIDRFKEAWKAAGPIDGQTLTTFLARTTNPECQAVANKFSFFLHLPAVKNLTVDTAAALAKHVGVLNLAGVEALDPDVAESLAKHKQGLLLYGLKDMSVETARALAQCEAVGLRAITALGQPQAAALATQRGLLNLSGVQAMTPETAAEFGGNHQGVLLLPRLESLSVGVAEGLSSHRGELHLAGVASLSPEAAAALGRGNGDRLVLTGLETLDRRVAEALAPYAGVLVIRCPQELDAELAAVLAKHEGGLFLAGPKTLSADAASELSRTKKCLCLQDVVSLDVDAARALSKCPNQLSLPAIKALTPEVASQLAKNDYALVLEGLGPLDPETAAELARCRGALHLPALQTLSVEAARELAKCRTHLHLAGLKIADPNLADALAQCEGKSLTLGLADLTPQVAQRLVRCSAELHLPNLQNLTEQVAEALARRDKSWLVLRGLRTLTRDVARELSMCRGDIDLSGLDSLAPEVAAELAKAPGKLVLNGLTTLSAEVAAALAEHDAPTVLQGVTSLTEDAAMAFAGCPHLVFSDKVRIVQDAPAPQAGLGPAQVVDGADETPRSQTPAKSQRTPKEPAKTARCVTDIMDEPEDYVNGTYTVRIWVDASAMRREKKILEDGTEILDGYCIRIKDGTRDAQTAESLGPGFLSSDGLVPVIRSKELARGLQDALPQGMQYRLDVTVTISRVGSPSERQSYLLMDLVRLEAKRADGTVVAVDKQSVAKDFAALRTVFEAPVAAATPRPAASPPAQVDPTAAAAEKLARFEAECDRVSSEIMAGYRIVSSSPRDIVSSCGDKLAEIGANQEKRMTGIGVSAGCAKGAITALGMYGLLVIEAGMKCIGQELPNGGFVSMVDSLLTQADEGLRESGNADKFWTHIAFIRTLIQLYGEANPFHADFERELLAGGAQPVVIRELQQIRRDICDLLMRRYVATVKAGLERYGPPSFPER